jgi:hypothetical protein
MLLPGAWVEVLSAREIAAALDAKGQLEGLPFMPEMVRYCGRRFRVALRAERTCAHPSPAPLRRLERTVTLAGLRCDGAAHGGCQLGCMLLWKEAWLRPVDGPAVRAEPPRPEGSRPSRAPEAAGGEPPPPGADPIPAPDAPALTVRDPADPARWVCQATALPAATAPGEPLWRPGQYVRFLRTRTFDLPGLVAMLGRPALRWVGRRARNAVAPRRSTPAGAPEHGELGLRPGEWVEVKSPAEIAATLDARRKNRGLAFSGEMVEYCGRRMRVAARVERIVDESTGALRTLRNTVLLERCTCDRYLGCARGMPLMWREAWLKRAPGGGEGNGSWSFGSSTQG